MEINPLIYLDNNASTPISPPVNSAICKVLSDFSGNPSSTHSAGRQTKIYIEKIRGNLANWLGVYPDQIVFTSGATESNNLVLQSVSQREQSPHIVTTTVEHPSILQPLIRLEDKGMSVHHIKVSSIGLIDLDELTELLSQKPDLVSIQWVNNETGVIQPTEKIITLCQEHNVATHIDAAQALGKLPINLTDLTPNYLTFSGHKLHAPAGIGALVCKEPDEVIPMIFGGDQEQGIRSGTENWLGIVGLGAAIEDRKNQLGEHIDYMASLRNQFEGSLTANLPFIKIMGQDAPRVCNTSNIMFTGLDGQALVAQLNGQDICCSQTSACSNQRPEPSYVLRAMGLNEQEAYSCVRFSVSPMNTVFEIETAINAVTECANRLLAFSGGVG